jgi:hypothetical protein
MRIRLTRKTEPPADGVAAAPAPEKPMTLAEAHRIALIKTYNTDAALVVSAFVAKTAWPYGEESRKRGETMLMAATRPPTEGGPPVNPGFVTASSNSDAVKETTRCLTLPVPLVGFPWSIPVRFTWLPSSLRPRRAES